MQVKFSDTILLFVFMVLLSACNDKICPAYSSYFILDNSNQDRIQIAYNDDVVPDESYNLFQNPIRDEYFSYMAEDSMPKEVDIDKTWYGVAKRKSINRRNKSLQTIPMEVVISDPGDSALFAGDETMFAEMEVDSTALDSLLEANAKTYKYNVDQKYYLWYFRNKLSWDDEETDSTATEDTAPLDEATEAVPSDTTKTKKKGLFKGGLFGKKKKNSEEGEEQPTEEENNEEGQGN